MQARLPALLIALLAVAVRLPRLGWGLPRIEEEARPLKVAFEMWGWAGEGPQLDPGTAGWPALSFYIHLLLQKIEYAVGRVTGAFSDPYDFYIQFLTDPSEAMWWGRALGVLAAAGVVYLGARLGGRLAGLAGTVLVGGSLALSPLLVEQSQRVTPDILMAFWVAWAIWAMVRIQQGGQPLYYALAGVAIGLGTATKYTPAVLVISLVAVHWLRRRQEARPLGWPALGDRRLWLAVVGTVSAFVVASPYTILRLDVLVRDWSYQLTHMQVGHFGQQSHTPGPGYYVFDVLAPGLGGPTLLLGTVGLLAATWRWRGSWLVLLICLVPYVAVLSALRTAFPHYALPLLLPICAGLAGLVLLGRDYLGAASASRRWILVLALALVVFVPQTRGTAAYLSRQGDSSTNAWAERHLATLPEPSYLVLEHYTVELPADEWVLSSGNDPVFQRLSPQQQARLRDRRFYPYALLPLYSVRPEYTNFFYDLRLYRPYEYVMVSSAVADRYLAEPQRFAPQVDFYGDLERFGELVWEAVPSDEVRGPQLSLYRLQPDDWNRVLAEKGPLPRDFHREYLAHLHPEPFQTMVSDLSRHAYDLGMYTEAELYTQALYDSLDPPAQQQLELRLGFLKIQIGEWDQAAMHLNAWLQRQPDHPEALVNLGWVEQNRGNKADARRRYERVIELAPYGDAASWARQRLDELNEEN